MLSKLYGLYNAVIDSVAGYNDVLWADLDMEKMTTELQDFQNRWMLEYISIRPVMMVVIV